MSRGDSLTLRTVQPRKTPVTLAELVLDLDERCDGDRDADLMIPAEEWERLLFRAEIEKHDKPATSFQPVPPAKKKRQRKAKGWRCDGCGYQHQGTLFGDEDGL